MSPINTDRLDAWDLASARLEEWNKKGDHSRRVGPQPLYEMTLELAKFIAGDIPVELLETKPISIDTIKEMLEDWDEPTEDIIIEVDDEKALRLAQEGWDAMNLRLIDQGKEPILVDWRHNRKRRKKKEDNVQPDQ